MASHASAYRPQPGVYYAHRDGSSASDVHATTTTTTPSDNGPRQSPLQPLASSIPLSRQQHGLAHPSISPGAVPFTNQLAHSSTFTPAGFSFDSPFRMNQPLPSPSHAAQSSHHAGPSRTGNICPAPGLDIRQSVGDDNLPYSAKVLYPATASMTTGDRFTQLLEEKMGLQQQQQQQQQLLQRHPSQDRAAHYDHQASFSAMPYAVGPGPSPSERMSAPPGHPSHPSHPGAGPHPGVSPAYPQPSPIMNPGPIETPILDQSQVAIPPDYVPAPIPHHFPPWTPSATRPHVPVSIPRVQVNGPPPPPFSHDASRPRSLLSSSSSTLYSNNEYWTEHAPSADMYPGSVPQDPRANYSLYSNERSSHASVQQPPPPSGSPSSRPSSHSPAVPSDSAWNYNLVGLSPAGPGWTSINPPNAAESSSSGSGMSSAPFAPNMMPAGSSASGESSASARANVERFAGKKQRISASPLSKKSSTDPVDTAHPPLSRSSLEVAMPSGQEDEQPDKKVVIACHNCRAKKLKCDGGRPRCHHCTRRGQAVCEYDAVLRRRGPGKNNKRHREKKKRASAAASA